MIVRSMLVIAALAFLALLGATLAGPGLEGTAAVTGTAWGRVTLGDFYLGVACFAVVIGHLEARWPVAAAWILALALGGNPVAVLWLLIRGMPQLAALRTAGG